MSWLLIAFDDDTLAAVLDDARVRSLEGKPEFVLLTPRDQRWGNERDQNDETYLHDLDAGVRRLQDEGVKIKHEWLPGADLVQEVVDVGQQRGATGAVIAHHNPDYAIPDPGEFDDAIRRQLDIALDIISLE